MMENDLVSTPTLGDTKGDSKQHYRLFVAPEYTPQTMPIFFTTVIIIMWAIVILVVAIAFYAYFMSVTR